MTNGANMAALGLGRKSLRWSGVVSGAFEKFLL